MGLAQYYREPFVANGGQVVSEQKYTGGDKDFKAQLTAIKAANPDAIFVPGYYTEAGLIVLCSFISPFKAERRLVRDTAAEGEFLEIFVEAPLETVIARDPKGLYKRALAGEIKNFTGVDQAYEAPEAPELILKSGEATAEALADRVVKALEQRGLIVAL